MIIIGIAGRARSGKDTAAQHLLDQYGMEPMSFAAPIKQAVADMFGLDERYLSELKEVAIPALGRSPRELFQTLGTDWGRQLVHPQVWIYTAGVHLGQLQAEYQEQGTQFPGVVFSDIRFENEAQFVRDRGGRVIHLVRNDAPQVAAHVSEAGVSPGAGDVTLTNNGGIDELYRKLDDVLRDLFNQKGVGQ